MFTPGDKLEFGHYTVLRELGSGGMGVVYHCRDEFLQREIAIKMLLPELMADDDTVETFHREARLAAQLEHPNIVTIHNIGMENRQGKVHHYLAMEFLPGGSLRERIGGEMIPLEQAVDWMKQVGTALNYAHKRGVLHQDIKPDNIFIAQEGNLKIGDFGLSLIATGLAYERAQGKGSPAYMSPELCCGDPHDHRSDIYSLGAVFYEILTGEHPFKNATGMIEMALKHAKAPIPSPRELRPDIPSVLEEALQKMLAKNPQERLQSLSDLLPELEKLLLELKVLRFGVKGMLSSPALAAPPAEKSVIPLKVKEKPADDHGRHKPVHGAKISNPDPVGFLEAQKERDKEKEGEESRGEKEHIDVVLPKDKLKELKSLWRYKVEAPIGWASVPVINRPKKVIYVAATDGVLYALDMNNGKSVWQFKADGQLVSSPLLAGNRIYCASAEGATYCLSAADGKMIWRYDGSGIQVCCPALQGDVLLISSLDGSLKCLSATDGALYWTYKTESGIVSSPQTAENTIFVASKDKGLHAVTMDRGWCKWQVEATAPIISQPLVSSDSVYFASIDGMVQAVDIETGRLSWQQNLHKALTGNGTMELSSLLYCAEDGTMSSIDRYKGTVTWQSQVTGKVSGGIASVTGSLYVSTTNGYLQSFNMRTGALGWYANVGLEMDAMPLVTSSVIYVGTVSGDVVAFAAPAKR